jgi:hypothetical protein
MFRKIPSAIDRKLAVVVVGEVDVQTPQLEPIDPMEMPS